MPGAPSRKVAQEALAPQRPVNSSVTALTGLGVLSGIRPAAWGWVSQEHPAPCGRISHSDSGVPAPATSSLRLEQPCRQRSPRDSRLALLSAPTQPALALAQAASASGPAPASSQLRPSLLSQGPGSALDSWKLALCLHLAWLQLHFRVLGL